MKVAVQTGQSLFLFLHKHSSTNQNILHFFAFLRKMYKNSKIHKLFFLQIILLVCTTWSCVNYQRIGKTKITQNNPIDTTITISDTSALSQFSDSTEQITDTNNLTGTTNIEIDTNNVVDTTNIEINIVNRKMRISPNAVTSIVEYSAKDSVEFDLANSKSIMYNETELNYEDVNLRSNRVEINFLKKELFASGDADTSGNLQGKPVFKQESYEFKCHELLYNFDSKKGLIRDVITQEGESYLHGELVKKNEDNTSYIYRGKYTTCNLECPHFEAAFNRAKVVPNNKIVTGLLWIRIASIPIVPLPFGLFPNTTDHKNGLLFPTYGLSDYLDKGPYLRDIGYYFAIKDKMDYAITATLYMRGAWGAKLASNYAKRYKFTGNYVFEYNFTPTGERTITENIPQAYKVTHDIKVYWKHQQDRKAHPTNNFSANVDFKTSTFTKNNVEQNNIYDNTKSKAMSTVSFSTSFKDKYSLGINARMSQDLVQGDLDMDLPQINFGISQFYPFRRKQVVGKLRWYENISMQYTMDFQNTVNTKDSILINHFGQVFDNMRTGMSHNIPIRSTIKILKYINWENSATLRETWQIKGVKQSWGEYDTTLKTNVHKDTMYGFFAAHDLSLASGLSTTLYGMYTMKKGRVSAFRHTLSPSVNFDYRPAINKHLYSTYEEEIYGMDISETNDTTYTYRLKDVQYSYLTGMLYGSPAYKSSGMINFSLSNKLEMKVRPSKKEKKKEKDDEEDDETFKKVTLLENLSISTSYDLLADSLNWGYLNINGRTLLFKQINISFNFDFDPYIIGENGYSRMKKTEWKANKRLFRLSNTGVDLSFGYNIDKNLFNKNKEKEKKVSPSGFGDWNINISYIFHYGMRDNPNYYIYYPDTNRKYTNDFTNSLTISGSFALTPKWNVRIQSGYNITQKAITPSDIYVERDLHCWTIHFRWAPFGYRSFEFGIRAKANILKDAQYKIPRTFQN